MENIEVEGTTANPELKEKLVSLYSYFAPRLGIKEIPKLVFTNSQKNSENSWGFTGYYDYETKTIKIYITDRHNTDILRSFAHEIIHHWQNERGTLNPTNQPEQKTQAHYAQENPCLRKREMEAYLFGNIMFRDWQDENRNGPPKIKPVLPQPYD